MHDLPCLSALASTVTSLNNASAFVNFISSILISCVIEGRRIKKTNKGWDHLDRKKYRKTYSSMSYTGIDKKIFWNVVCRVLYSRISPQSSVVSINNITFYEDYDRLMKGLAYVGTTDLHEGNFGIIKSQNPSPDDIVILDFDIKG